MAVITGGSVIEGTLGPIYGAAAPGAGTDAVQTITFAGSGLGGTFTLSFEGYRTAAIPWSAVNATLQASIDSALEALPNVGASGVVTAVGTAVAGIGTFTVTFSGPAMAKRAVGTMTADYGLMTGTNPSVTVATTTPGVAATGRGTAKGGSYVDTATGIHYMNTGTDTVPTWTKTGTQT